MKYRVIERFGNVEERFILQFRCWGTWETSGTYRTLEEAVKRGQERSDGYRVVWP